MKAEKIYTEAQLQKLIKQAVKKARNEGYDDGAEVCYKFGYDDGFKEGELIGFDAGYEKGYNDARSD